MRHAKSSWDNPTMSDRTRPLNERGRRIAPKMGALIRKLEYLPDMIYCSTAQRTRETLELLTSEIGLIPRIHFSDAIYEASVGSLVELIQNTSDEFQSIMIIGHNPGMELCIKFFTDELIQMPTATIVLIELNIDSWAEVSISHGKIVDVLRPKEIF